MSTDGNQRGLGETITSYVRYASSHWLWVAFSVTATFVSLVLPDFFVLFFDPKYDGVVHAALSFCFFWFVIDIMASAILLRAFLLSSPFFYLDMIATLSLLPNVVQFLTGREFGMASDVTLARASRIARSATRLARLARLTKLVDTIGKVKALFVPSPTDGFGAIRHSIATPEEPAFDARSEVALLDSVVTEAFTRRVVLGILVLFFFSLAMSAVVSSCCDPPFDPAMALESQLLCCADAASPSYLPSVSSTRGGVFNGSSSEIPLLGTPLDPFREHAGCPPHILPCGERSFPSPPSPSSGSPAGGAPLLNSRATASGGAVEWNVSGDSVASAMALARCDALLSRIRVSTTAAAVLGEMCDDEDDVEELEDEEGWDWAGSHGRRSAETSGVSTANSDGGGVSGSVGAVYDGEGKAVGGVGWAAGAAANLRSFARVLGAALVVHVNEHSTLVGGFVSKITGLSLRKAEMVVNVALNAPPFLRRSGGSGGDVDGDRVHQGPFRGGGGRDGRRRAAELEEGGGIRSSGRGGGSVPSPSRSCTRRSDLLLLSLTAGAGGCVLWARGEAEVVFPPLTSPKDIPCSACPNHPRANAIVPFVPPPESKTAPIERWVAVDANAPRRGAPATHQLSPPGGARQAPPSPGAPSSPGAPTSPPGESEVSDEEVRSAVLRPFRGPDMLAYDGTILSVVLDRLSAAAAGAIVSLSTTLFLLVIMIIGNVVVLSDVQVLVLEPVASMVRAVRQIASGIMPSLSGSDPLLVEQALSSPKKLELSSLELAVLRVTALVRLAMGRAGVEIMKDVLAGQTINTGGVERAHFLFCDIRSFTTITEVIASDALRFVNAVAGHVHESVVAHGGAPITNIGDAFMCVFSRTTFRTLLPDEGGCNGTERAACDTPPVGERSRRTDGGGPSAAYSNSRWDSSRDGVFDMSALMQLEAWASEDIGHGQRPRCGGAEADVAERVAAAIGTELPSLDRSMFSASVGASSTSEDDDFSDGYSESGGAVTNTALKRPSALFREPSNPETKRKRSMEGARPPTSRKRRTSRTARFSVSSPTQHAVGSSASVDRPWWQPGPGTVGDRQNGSGSTQRTNVFAAPAMLGARISTATSFDTHSVHPLCGQADMSVDRPQSSDHGSAVRLLRSPIASSVAIQRGLPPVAHPLAAAIQVILCVDADSLVQSFGSAAGLRVRMGVGLHTGAAVVGALGSTIKADPTYLSPDILLTEALEAGSKQVGVPLLLSASVRRCLAQPLRRLCRPCGDIKIEGMSAQVFAPSLALIWVLAPYLDGQTLPGIRNVVASYPTEKAPLHSFEDMPNDLGGGRGGVAPLRWLKKGSGAIGKMRSSSAPVRSSSSFSVGSRRGGDPAARMSGAVPDPTRLIVDAPRLLALFASDPSLRCPEPVEEGGLLAPLLRPAAPAGSVSLSLDIPRDIVAADLARLRAGRVASRALRVGDIASATAAVDLLKALAPDDPLIAHYTAELRRIKRVQRVHAAHAEHLRTAHGTPSPQPMVSHADVQSPDVIDDDDDADDGAGDDAPSKGAGQPLAHPSTAATQPHPSVGAATPSSRSPRGGVLKSSDTPPTTSEGEGRGGPSLKDDFLKESGGSMLGGLARDRLPSAKPSLSSRSPPSIAPRSSFASSAVDADALRGQPVSIELPGSPLAHSVGAGGIEARSSPATSASPRGRRSPHSLSLAPFSIDAVSAVPEIQDCLPPSSPRPDPLPAPSVPNSVTLPRACAKGDSVRSLPLYQVASSVCSAGAGTDDGSHHTRSSYRATLASCELSQVRTSAAALAVRASQSRAVSDKASSSPVDDGPAPTHSAAPDDVDVEM